MSEFLSYDQAKQARPHQWWISNSHKLFYTPRFRRDTREHQDRQARRGPDLQTQRRGRGHRARRPG